MKKLISLALALTLAMSLAACNSGESVPSETPKTSSQATSSEAPIETVNLEGEWKQSNSGSETAYQSAVIQGDVIEIYWIDEDNETRSLYWSGTAYAPEPGETEFSWDSKNDTSKTSVALLASSDDTKKFTYKDGEISYEASAMGTTATVKLKKTSDTISNPIQPAAESSEAESEPDESSQTPYKIGETWTVDGQWELTITGVDESDFRNEYSEKTPAAVYNVKFSYTNIGFEDEFSDGLFITLDDTIIDSQNQMGYSYPGEITDYTQETPVGATCNAEVCIGVDNAGSFQLIVTKYDGNSQKHTATFQIDV